MSITSTDDAKAVFTGEVFLDHWRDGKCIAEKMYMGKNTIPTEGLNYMLNVAATPNIGGTAKESAWYCSIFSSNATILSSANAATYIGAGNTLGEVQGTGYTVGANDSANRANYTVANSTAGVITNSASKAEFTIGANATIYGAFITSSATKSANTGVLLALKKFDSARTVITGDILYVTYQITANSA